MTIPPDDNKVGYGRPPKKHRWKKGQRANNSRKRKRTENLLELVDRLLLSPVELVLNGESETIPALVAIISQLQLKEMTGNVQASKVLLKYRVLASQHGERELQLIFKDNERAPASPVREK